VIQEEYDVIVVGAGPAGSTVAYELAKNGVKTLLLDKKSEDWEKPCGGAISARRFKEFNIPTDIASSKAKYIDIHTPSGMSRTRYTNYIVKRKDLDMYLAKRAAEEGAVLNFETKFEDFKLEEGVTVTTSKRKFRSKVLIGADGVNSTVRAKCKEKYGGKFKVNKSQLAPSANVLYKGKHDLDAIHIFADKNIAPHGYGWLFPRGKDILEVGVGSVRIDGATYSVQESLQRFEETCSHIEGFKRLGSTQKGYWILHDPLEQISTNRVLLCGEAAGLIPKIVCSGISTGMISGRVATRFILDAIDKQKYSFSGYREQVLSSLGMTYELCSEYWDWKVGGGKGYPKVIEKRHKGPNPFENYKVKAYLKILEKFTQHFE